MISLPNKNFKDIFPKFFLYLLIRKSVTQLLSNKIASSFQSLGYVLWDSNPEKSWEMRPKNLGNKNRFLKDSAKFFFGLKNQLNQA